MQTIIIKTLECPLPALTLSEDQCTKIMAPVLQGALAKIAINQTMPKALKHGPIDEGRININSLYTIQGVLQIQKLQQHLGENTVTGKLICVSLETCILEVGVGRNLFQLDYDRFGPLVTNS